MEIEQFMELLDAIRFDDEAPEELRGYARFYYSSLRKLINLARESGYID